MENHPKSVERSRSQNNNPITFDKAIADPRKCANQFNIQFTPQPPKLDKSARQTKCKFKAVINDFYCEIRPADVTAAIKKIKNSKAMGPDDISPVMLKHIGTKGMEFLTKLLNLLIQTLTISQSWKTAKIVPILKPDKNPDVGASYRPISLLSPFVKLMESLLLPLLTEEIALADHQHGFRK